MLIILQFEFEQSQSTAHKTKVIKKTFLYKKIEYFSKMVNPGLALSGLNLAEIHVQGSKFIFGFGGTCATRCKFLGALPKF